MQTLPNMIWSNYFEVGSAAIVHGRLETAQAMFAAALAEAETHDLSPLKEVASLHGLASAFYRSGQRGRSDMLLRKAFRILCQIESATASDICRIACTLADSYMEQGQMSRAMPVLRAAASRVEKKQGGGTPALAGIFKRIALIYALRGRALKADKYLQLARHNWPQADV